MKPTNVLVDVRLFGSSRAYTFVCPVSLFKTLTRGDIVAVDAIGSIHYGEMLHINNSPPRKNIKYKWLFEKVSAKPEKLKSLGEVDINTVGVFNRKLGKFVCGI